MNYKKAGLAIILATFWISVSEFLRNQLLLHSSWVEYYANRGLEFPESALNGALWVVWSLLLAICIYVISRKFTLWQTVLLAWVFGFVMMWGVVGSLGVLPLRILWLAVPLSIIEVLFATWIVTTVDAEN